MAFANLLKTGRCVKNKLGRPGLADPFDVFGIYQMRKTKKGRYPVRMQFYENINPRTPAQQANRLKFKQANAAYYTLTNEQKQWYIEEARKKNTFPWTLFIKEYFKNH